jgi:hypothetical protein
MRRCVELEWDQNKIIHSPRIKGHSLRFGRSLCQESVSEL